MKKFKKRWLIILLVICVLGGSYFIFNSNKNKKNNNQNILVKPKCNFELLDVKISRYQKDGPDLEKIKELEKNIESIPPKKDNNHFYEMNKSALASRLYWEKNSKDKLTWIGVEGMIKLNGNKDQTIKNIVSKVYTNDDKKVYLGEAYIDINKTLSPGTSYPFKLSITLDRNIELIGKYFNKDDEVKIDTSPYFLSCDY